MPAAASIAVMHSALLNELSSRCRVPGSMLYTKHCVVSELV
jgi:hypothetical protein